MASYVHVQALESCLGWHSKEIKTNVWRNPTRKQSPAYISCFQYLVVKTTTQGQLCKVNYGDKENETWLDFMLVYQDPPPPTHLSFYSYILFISYALIHVSAWTPVFSSTGRNSPEALGSCSPRLWRYESSRV